MNSWRYPSCDDVRRHQDDARSDARYHSHMHQPSRFDEPDCRRAYDDEYRRQEQAQQERAEQEAAERREQARAEEARQQARWEEERQQEQAYEDERERQYYADQEAAMADASMDSMEGVPEVSQTPPLLTP